MLLKWNVESEETKDARRALLKKLATVTDWDAASRASFAGESWLETRNTLYRFRDGVCFAVASRDPRKAALARAIVGMRLVGWLSGSGARIAREWEAGARGLLWRSQRDGDDGERSDETMAMTSKTVSFKRGRSAAHLQALHDKLPPVDSQTFRREVAKEAPVGVAPVRPRLPSSSYRSG